VVLPRDLVCKARAASAPGRERSASPQRAPSHSRRGAGQSPGAGAAPRTPSVHAPRAVRRSDEPKQAASGGLLGALRSLLPGLGARREGAAPDAERPAADFYPTSTRELRERRAAEAAAARRVRAAGDAEAQRPLRRRQPDAPRSPDVAAAAAEWACSGAAAAEQLLKPRVEEAAGGAASEAAAAAAAPAPHEQPASEQP